MRKSYVARCYCQNIKAAGIYGPIVSSTVFAEDILIVIEYFAPITFSFHRTALMLPGITLIRSLRTYPVHKIAINETLAKVRTLQHWQQSAYCGVRCVSAHPYLLHVTLVPGCSFVLIPAKS